MICSNQPAIDSDVILVLLISVRATAQEVKLPPLELRSPTLDMVRTARV